MKGEIGEGALLHGFAGAMRRLGQGLVALQLVSAEGDQSGQPGMGGGQRTQRVVVVPVQMDVAVDQAGEDKLAGSVDVPVGWRQVVFRANGDDLLAGDGYGALVNLGRGDDLPAHDDRIHMIRCHAGTSFC